MISVTVYHSWSLTEAEKLISSLFLEAIPSLGTGCLVGGSGHFAFSVVGRHGELSSHGSVTITDNSVRVDIRPTNNIVARWFSPLIVEAVESRLKKVLSSS